MKTILCLVMVALGWIHSVARADTTVDQVLQQLHDRGNDLKTLAADVVLKTADTELGDPDWDTRTGRITVERQQDGHARLRVTFLQRERGKRVEQSRREYVLDGEKLIERDYQEKRQVVRVVRKPGEKLDLFRLGEGPFPLPIGQPPDEVRKEFEVRETPPDKPEPGLTYIQLVPHKDRPMADRFAFILVGVNADGWPVFVQTLDKNGVQTTEARLSNLRINDPVDSKAFDLEPIDDSWKKFEGGY